MIRSLSREELPFPTSTQLDLLRAALLPAAQAAPAWRRWNDRGMRLEVLDPSSHRMLSQLWTNREAADVGAGDLPLLKGVYRQALAENAVTVAAGLEGVRALEAAEMPVVLIKGAALLAVAGGRLGLRKTADMDVLVPEREHRRAVRALIEAGYEPMSSGDYVVAKRTWVGRDAQQLVLDLHKWAYKSAGDDAGVFAGARTRTLLGRSVLVPSASEMLCGVIAHGVAPGLAAPMRWIGDAMTLLSLEGDDVDWDFIVNRAIARELALPIGAGLEFLVAEFGAAVPDGVLRELAAASTSLRSRWSHQAAMSPGRFAWLFTDMERHRILRAYLPHVTHLDVLGYVSQVRGDSSRRAYLRRKVRDVIG